jgi:hypothetical protein
MVVRAGRGLIATEQSQKPVQMQRKVYREAANALFRGVEKIRRGRA